MVENRAGGGTILGTQTAATAPPDGYTLLIGGLANMAFNLALHKDPALRPGALISRRSRWSAPLPTRSSAARTCLLASLRSPSTMAKANPGKLTIATSGVGTGQHVSALMLKPLEYRPARSNYKGAQPAYADLLPGAWISFSTIRRPRGPSSPMAASSRTSLRLPARDALLPEVPTAREAGCRLVLDSWMGLFAPAKTPRAVVERLRDATLKALAETEVRRPPRANGWRSISMSLEETRRVRQARGGQVARVPASGRDQRAVREPNDARGPDPVGLERETIGHAIVTFIRHNGLHDPRARQFRR